MLTLYIVFAWLIGICYGFVLISSAAGQNDVNLFQSGQVSIYQLHSTVLLNENSVSAKNVGFFITGDILVHSVWGSNDERILKIELRAPQLHIKSRKAPSPDGFIQHSSKLESYSLKPFYVAWNSGKIERVLLPKGEPVALANFKKGIASLFQLRAPQLHIKSRKAPSPDGFIQHSSKLESYSLKPFYVAWNSGTIERVLLPKGEPVALANFKKGIASLFQFQILDVETNETDSSGHCKTTYQTIDTTRFYKTKSNCVSPDLPYVRTTDPILDVVVSSNRQVTYELNPELTTIKTIYSKETHRMTLAVKEDIGSMVDADQILNHSRDDKTQTLRGPSLEAVWELLKTGHEEDNLVTKREEVPNEDKTFPNVVNDLRENIATKNLGTAVSAKAFLRLLEVAKKASKDEITKVLGVKKNQKILPQIYDVLGYIQTIEAHSAIMKKLHFDREDHLALSERYLWALSLSQHPNPAILKDLLDRYRKNDNYPDKVKETLILTVAAMAHALRSNPQERKIINTVEEVIINNLNYAKDEKRYSFFRALQNLKSVNTIPLLLESIKNGTPKEGVLALKALKAMGSEVWDAKLLQRVRRIFLQIDRKYDSSARTLAADVLLENDPSDDILEDLIYYLKFNDTNPEVKQYTMQRLQTLQEEDEHINLKVSNLIKSDPGLNNYAVLSPRGLSTALKRSFTKNPSVNGSLFSAQEMFGGVIKRGVFNVMINKNNNAKEMISLGIFAGGLSSFTGNEVEGDDDTATAGIDLSILDRQIRPFVFFNGQGELMGHVWSGTASERTPAFQSLILLQDHLEFIRLSPGFIAEFNLKTAMSFDLSGQIEISIWSRTADAFVEKSAGIVSNGLIIIDTAFVRSQIEFSASIEPKLQLKSDSDFSGDTNFCVRVSHPDTIFRHNVFKIERIPGSKHKMRIAKYKKVQIPGITYSLTRKNNEMCSALYS